MRLIQLSVAEFDIGILWANDFRGLTKLVFETDLLHLNFFRILTDSFLSIRFLPFDKFISELSEDSNMNQKVS